MDELTGKIEALLFARGETMRFEDLCRVLGVSGERLREALNALRERYNLQPGGITLVERPEEVALGTRPEFGDFIQAVFKEDLSQELTPAALETFAIIAYRGPISRPSVDMIRGVNSTFMVRNLMIRGLIDRTPDPKRHNVWRYEITLESMKMLGITRQEELPNFGSLSKSLSELGNAI